MMKRSLTMSGIFLIGCLTGYLLNIQRSHECYVENQSACDVADNTRDYTAVNKPDVDADKQPIPVPIEVNGDSSEGRFTNTYDFPESLENILTLESGESRTSQVRAILDVWSRQNPQAALEWLDTLPVNSETESYYYQVMLRYMVTDIELAGYALQKLPTETLRNSLSGQYIFHLSSKNPEQALSWALNTSEQTFRQAFGIMSEQDPETALNYLKMMGSSIEPDIIGDGIRRAAINMSHKNMAEVKKALNSYPEDVRQYLVSGMAQVWAKDDRAAAAKWVESLDNPVLKNQAIQGFVDGTVEAAPSEAFRLTSQISDEHARLALMFNIVGQWSDRNAARLAVERTSQLSGEQRNLLLGQISH